MEENASQDADEKDLAILVESLRSYETLEPRTRREIFGIIRSLLSKNKMAQNYFRELQGIDLLIHMYKYYSKNKDAEMIGNSLFTLGVAAEQNDVTRSVLITSDMFTMVKGAIKLSLVPSAFLLLCLTSNNVAGQELSRTSHCINKLCSLLKANITEQTETNEMLVSCDALCTTLCAIMSNPVNKTNQEICCRLLLPTLVRTLYLDINRQILQSIINVIGSCIIDNSDSQKYLRVVGGIRALAALLQKSLSGTGTVENQAEKMFMMHLVNTLSCSYTNNSANKVQAIELDAIQALLRCLQTYSGCGRECELHITCVSALLNLFDEEDSSVVQSGKQRFQEGGGIAVLIELLTTQDEKLKKLLTVLLHKTFNKEALSTNNCKAIETTVLGGYVGPEKATSEISNNGSESGMDTPNNKEYSKEKLHNPSYQGGMTLTGYCTAKQSAQNISIDQEETMNRTRDEDDRYVVKRSGNSSFNRSTNAHLTEDYTMLEKIASKSPADKEAASHIKRTTRQSFQEHSSIFITSIDTPSTDGCRGTTEKTVTEKLTDRPASVNTLRATKRSLERSCNTVNGSINTPLRERHSTPKKTRDRPASMNTWRVTRSMEKARNFLTNGSTKIPLSAEQSYSTPEKVSNTTPRSKQTSRNTRRVTRQTVQRNRNILANSCSSSTQLSECYSSPEKMDDKVTSDKQGITPRSKYSHGCSCGNLPYIDSHNALSVLNSDLACSYHNSMGRALSRYLKQARLQLEEHSDQDIGAVAS